MDDLNTIRWLDVGVAIFGLGFAIWGFYVRKGTQALSDMKASIETIVGLKLENIDRRLSELVETSKHTADRIYRLEVNHEKRIAVVEETLERVTKL